MGEGAIREAAAFLLDHGGFAGVPPTALVNASHPGLCYRTELAASAGDDAPVRVSRVRPCSDC